MDMSQSEIDDMEASQKEADAYWAKNKFCPLPGPKLLSNVSMKSSRESEIQKPKYSSNQ